MSKKIFSQEEQRILRENPYVLKVSKKSITYTDEFKIHLIAEYSKGKTARIIFEEAGFDIEIIGIKRVDCAAIRWKKAYKQHGVLGLRDTRKGNSGRPRERELTPAEIIAKKDAEIAYLKAELELVKKLELEERKVINGKIKPSQIFGLIELVIEKHKSSGVVRHLCKLAGVSSSGYYNYLNTRDHRAVRHEQDLEDFAVIQKAYKFKGFSKGSRGIYMALKNVFGVIFNRKKIQRLMRKFNLICPIRRTNPYKRIAKATKEHSVVPNRLDRKFKEGIPGQILLTDITYISFRGSFAYLSVIKDSITNEILAYHLSKNIKLEIVMKTLDRLFENHGHRFASNAYVHSDQGSHYTSPIFQKKLKEAMLGQSMSRKGNCWDNAPMESFFGHMKDEVDFEICASYEEIQEKVDRYMDYYNHSRAQWNLKKLTPVMYRNQLLAA